MAFYFSKPTRPILLQDTQSVSPPSDRTSSYRSIASSSRCVVVVYFDSAAWAAMASWLAAPRCLTSPCLPFC